ncbi:hypothetical protein OAA91_00350 [Fibrobacterales bacterium]|nr:hypothetical protein [Fibrobacterales bacterium]
MILKHLILTILLGSFLNQVSAGLIDKIGGNFSLKKQSWQEELNPKSKKLILESLNRLDSTEIVDIHMHVVGNGSSGSGAWINPEMTDWLSFKKNLQYKVYKSASGVTEDSLLDQQAFERLSYLIQNHSYGGRYFIMAFDSYYHKNGEIDLHKTEFYIPNNYVWKLAQTNPKMEAIVSIHPYRKDAIQEVQKWGKKGVRFIKWLPNAMGMDAADSNLIPFYQEVKKHNMTILTHVGEEKAVESEDDQKLGNPLRFRLPLNMGVKVIMAHCASLGEDTDFDHPDLIERSSFELFERMMDNPKYNGILFGDISAIMLSNRLGKPLLTVLNRTDWHRRLIQGSDYPIPAVNILVRLSPLHKQGFITQDEKEALEELYKVNPLLFDLVLKTFLKHPQTGQKFSNDVFYLPKEMIRK